MVHALSATHLRAAKKRLIFPLDVDSLAEAKHLITSLSDEVGLFKVGKQLFVHAGPDIVRFIHQKGGQVFLDLKFHDIPHTVASAGIEAARLGVAMFNVHASGGFDMMQTTRKAVQKMCRAEQLRRPVILAVTVLTSLNRDDLKQTGVPSPVETQVVRLAHLAQQAGLNGVVASPLELARLRQECRSRFQLVIPGVRPLGSAQNDQKRIMTPREAIGSGADYVVVGRPIRDAVDPRQAARHLVEEIAHGIAQASHRQK